MPYYVQLYEFDAKFRNIDDPLESYNLIETFEQAVSGTGRTTGTSSGTANGTANTTGGKTVKTSDTPQGSIYNLDMYLTQATQEDGTTNATTNTTTTDSNEQSSENSGNTTHTLTRKGNIGVQPLGGEVENIRNAFINIDLQIIEELSDLFLMIY